MITWLQMTPTDMSMQCERNMLIKEIKSSNREGWIINEREKCFPFPLWLMDSEQMVMRRSETETAEAPVRKEPSGPRMTVDKYSV